MPRQITPPRFCKTLLALAASAALAPQGAWALTLTQAPPDTTKPYVAPNVILSIDDSGSMNWQITNTNAGDDSITTPLADGSWDPRAKRINLLRYALNQVFTNTTLLPDKKIRLSWQAMWNNGSAPNALSVDSTSMVTNSMRPLQGTHRTNFLSFVTSLKAQNGTPSHLMFSQADSYMRRDLGINSPWAYDPGATATPYLGCRRNYHIFFTDGRWNGAATATTVKDNTTNYTLPDGTVFGGTTAAEQAKTALYRDTSTQSTLADWAFNSWAVPLQPAASLTGAPQPTKEYNTAPATENFGKDSAGKDAILDRYWNPRYDPATWAHMTTFTIGISTDATTWPYAPATSIVAPSQQVPFGYDNSFLDFVTGTQTWPDLKSTDDGQKNNHALDLWHAALNGRGKFYAVMKGEDLQKAFEEIIGKINSETDPGISSSAASGSNSTRSDVGKYISNYNPKEGWRGYVEAYALEKGGINVSPAWSGKNTADLLDARTDIPTRLVLSWSDKKDTNYKEQGGVPFQWASDESNLSAAQKTWLQKNVSGTDEGATKGQQRLNYVRGDKSNESATGLRQRQSRQGDIINSSIWYTGAPTSNYALKGYQAFTRANKSRATTDAMIYVGGNDGMLHGFSAADGSERLAYVPKGVIPTLRLLTDASFNQNHKYFVDGSPMTGDVDMGTGVQDPSDPAYDPNYTPGWRTLLVGTLGAGGKGYFALDVTNPTSNPVNSVNGFAEANAQQIAVLDRTRGAGETPRDCVTGLSTTQKNACSVMQAEDDDIGHIIANPVLDANNSTRSTQITRMNNNRWAVVLGNGYNSKNQRPVLLIQYLDGGRELLRIPVTTDAPGTGKAADNGLAAPQLVDLNGDGRPDIAYAGDNQGNLWKFDLTNVSGTVTASAVADTSNWGVAFGGSPLFTAMGPASLGSSGRTIAQPITAPPVVRANDRSKIVGTGPSAQTLAVGGMMVAFGSGRNVADGDANNNNVQTLYSVLDNTRYRKVSTTKGDRLQVHPGGGTCSPTPAADCVPAPAALGSGVTAANLAQQKITELSGGQWATVDSVAAVDWLTNKGWYLDLPGVGERLLKPLEFYDGSNLLTVWSQAPAKGNSSTPTTTESCDNVTVTPEVQYRTFINIMDGKRPKVQLVDINGNGIYDASDLGVSRAKVTPGPHTLITQGDRILDIASDVNNKARKEATLARMPEQSLRPSWRQLK